MIVLSIDWHIIGLMRFKSPEGGKGIELSFRAGGKAYITKNSKAFEKSCSRCDV